MEGASQVLVHQHSVFGIRYPFRRGGQVPMLGRILRLIILASAWLAATGMAIANDAPMQREIRLSVLAFRPKPITEAQWRPVADYLAKSLNNRPVTLVALTYPELEEAVAKRKVDFVLTQTDTGASIISNGSTIPMGMALVMKCCATWPAPS
jgi:ABC-type amino acid transport substrate-binding protein